MTYGEPATLCDASSVQVAGETEVKAQIKLRIRTAAGVPVVIIRSFLVRLNLIFCKLMEIPCPHTVEGTSQRPVPSMHAGWTRC